MAGILKNHWWAIRAANKQEISHEIKNWTTAGVRNPTRQYNNTAHQLSAHDDNVRVIATRQYSEILECPENPTEYAQYPYSYRLSVYYTVPNTQAVIGHHETDTVFALRIYRKMLKKYQNQQNQKPK